MNNKYLVQNYTIYCVYDTFINRPISETRTDYDTYRSQHVVHERIITHVMRTYIIRIPGIPHQ